MKRAISVKNLYIRYDSAQKRSIRTIFSKQSDKIRCVKALKKVSFEIFEGEIVGIIGSNGSGKSTLLRALGGLMAPCIGSVDLYGNSVSLLALGTGFIGDLSGRDNIILSGLSLGVPKKEIMKKFDSIVQFSELGDSIDRPVKTYSSGMYSKLAFSIAVTLHSDILLIDEVLSVGDINFRKKSRAVLEYLIKDKKRTVLIVSHNMAEIKNLCSRVIWLEHGHVKAIGKTESVLDLYHKTLARDPQNITYLDPPVLKVQSFPDKVVLRWNPVKNASDYRIYRKENIPGSQWCHLADGYQGSSFVDIPPSKEISYLYTIRARTSNKAGNVWSNHNPGIPGSLKAE